MKHSIWPEGEPVRRAIRWLSDCRRLGTELSSLELVGEAALRFDLSPLEEEWMLRQLVEHPVDELGGEPPERSFPSAAGDDLPETNVRS